MSLLDIHILRFSQPVLLCLLLPAALGFCSDERIDDEGGASLGLRLHTFVAKVVQG
jgi:hypothetical protein